MDINHKCSYFIGHYNHMMSNFGHLNPESVVILFKSYCCSFYGNITVIVLVNAVHNGTNALEEYIICHTTHIDGYWALIGQYHIRHQFILRDIKFLHSLLQSTYSFVRQCIMNASSNANTKYEIFNLKKHD